MEKNNYKQAITLFKLNQIRLCYKPIIIYQYDSELTTQCKFQDRSDGLWELVEDHLQSYRRNC